MAAAILYAVAFAGFLLGCLLAAILTEPSHDAIDESLFGDLPRVPGDYEHFHDTAIITGGQRCGE